VNVAAEGLDDAAVQTQENGRNRMRQLSVWFDF